MRSKTIDGHTISVERVPEKDTHSHRYYRFTLELPSGEKLFGKAGDTVGIPRGYTDVVSATMACYNGFCAATMQEGDTDPDWFDDYTPAELAWSRTFECESLKGISSEREERYYQMAQR